MTGKKITIGNQHINLATTQFHVITDILFRICGISMNSSKKELVKARLNKRLRELGLNDFKQYLAYIEEDPTHDELAFMIDRLTTNKTEFYREDHHFEYFNREILPNRSKLRIWSAGCSSGEEPYTIALEIARHHKSTAFDARILATDISAEMLERGRAAVYPKSALEGVPPMVKQNWFQLVPGETGMYRIHPEIQRLVSFARLNLMDAWRMQGPFDVIFCRNVMIYFNKDTQHTLVNRFADMLAPGGFIFVGHSESLAGMDHPYTYIEPAIYRLD